MAGWAFSPACRSNSSDERTRKSQIRLDAQEKAFFEEPNTAAYLKEHFKPYKNCQSQRRISRTDVGFGVVDVCSGVRWMCTSSTNNCGVAVKFECESGEIISIFGRRATPEAAVNWQPPEVELPVRRTPGNPGGRAI